MPTIWIVIIVVVAVLLVLSFTPRMCVVEGNRLKVRTWLLTIKFDLSQAIEVKPISKSQLSPLKTIRLFGVGWPFKPYGWFRTAELGTFLNLVNDSSNMCMVRFPKKQILVSPPICTGDLLIQLKRQTM